MPGRPLRAVEAVIQEESSNDVPPLGLDTVEAYRSANDPSVFLSG
jgi:hypothetical protein